MQTLAFAPSKHTYQTNNINILYLCFQSSYIIPGYLKFNLIISRAIPNAYNHWDHFGFYLPHLLQLVLLYYLMLLLPDVADRLPHLSQLWSSAP